MLKTQFIMLKYMNNLSNNLCSQLNKKTYCQTFYSVWMFVCCLCVSFNSCSSSCILCIIFMLPRLLVTICVNVCSLIWLVTLIIHYHLCDWSVFNFILFSCDPIAVSIKGLTRDSHECWLFDWNTLTHYLYLDISKLS